jgi:hypothetical protein
VVAGGKDRALSCLMNSPRPALGANVTPLAERVLERADRLSISSLNHADAADIRGADASAAGRSGPDGSPTVSFVSLGCPKALVDSERIITQLRREVMP